MIHVSLDIEALGEVVVSIGACRFDLSSGESHEEFYRVLNVDLQLEKGLKASGEAFLWWLRQSDEAQQAVYLSTAHAPVPALIDFAEWLNTIGVATNRKNAWFWAYPTSFDLPIIERVARAFGLRAPWHWPQTIDGRTLWQLALAKDPGMKRVEQDPAEVDHHALHDAKQQARWYAAYWKAVMGGRQPA